MKKSTLIILLLFFAIMVFAQQRPVVKTQQAKQVELPTDAPSGKFIGTIFNDFSFILQEPQALDKSKGTSGMNAFLFRRATIGYEHWFNKDVSGKIMYDAGNKVIQQGFVDIRNIVPLIDLKIGMVQTLSSEVIEKIWDYRSLEATVLDRKGFTDEFDMGMTITGRTNASGITYARIAVYNGNGLVAENDKVKKIAFAAGNWFDKFSVVELYADYENLPSGQSTINTKVFYGMTSAKMAFGAEGFYRLERKMNIATGSNVNPAGASLYSWFEMMKSLRAVVRIDFVDDDISVTTTGYREVYVIGGIDYSPVSDVRLIPNLIYTKNLKKGTGSEIVDAMEIRLTTAINIK